MKPLPAEELKEKAAEIRQEIIKMLVLAGSGHSAGPLGLADIFAALFFNILNHDPENPHWEDRDRFFLSCGHVAPAYYATLALAGYFPMSYLKTLRRLDSPLQGHPERMKLSMIESSSGPLGLGLAQAAGYAYAARMDEARFRIFCLTSDAEHQEGNHWEAVMFAGKNKLNNLTSFIDRNNIQISGDTEEIMPLEPLRDKYESFRWNVIEINGHDFDQIISAVGSARRESDKPTVIIAKTVPGRGVSSMEGKYEWHGKAPSESEAKQALKELKYKK
ncbi:MAG: hypothetical protein UV74_C0001G0020 [Candidatus Woesebacteria bacterium GW2011_GWB1_43_14]|uniref:Transketolase N-terminal domain-containing protein n=1 Tax=Candidatus Woesebacteria bacterium GW2011_GWB1_43_14 TaxID=1618578 RepID=A0A0G1DM02_9BACT|nr:MAG: Transketolase domain protein [Candidatus Woesebacteria bacterium GW2011_GWC1_42_9]KKS98910.1 MAG: hypothetical protein UV74_C0001G0020 [Candidatus Woesebacteria bacterium GW2011_GWB1_43_14]